MSGEPDTDGGQTRRDGERRDPDGSHDPRAGLVLERKGHRKWFDTGIPLVVELC